MKVMRFYVRCDHDNTICDEHQSTIGRARTIKSAKAIIRATRKDSGIFRNPHNFKVYDCFEDKEPIVYEEQ